jgi:leucine dehydrogenase
VYEEVRMEDLLRQWDGETVITQLDKPTGAWIFIAIHSTRLGPAGGGTRMKSYPTVEASRSDAQNLVAGMTFTFAVVGFPFGGGKCVIAVPPGLDAAARSDLLRRCGALVYQLGGLFYTGPDVGTSSADMDIIAETGSPYVFARTVESGGAGDSGPYTALGVHHAILTTCGLLFGQEFVAGRRVLVQGGGSVGSRLIERLRMAGADILFSDVEPATIRRLRDEAGVPFVEPEAVYETDCDIFAPCALGGVLNAETIPRLRCRAVVGAANNQLAAPDDAIRLQEREIFYAPDVVVNVGGAMAIVGIETMGWTPAAAEERVVSAVAGTLRRVFDLASAEGVTTTAAMRRIADGRLSKQA